MALFCVLEYLILFQQMENTCMKEDTYKCSRKEAAFFYGLC